MSAVHPQPDEFWEYLGHLVAGSRLVIDRPKGSAHPRYPQVIYPLDYGFLEGTTAGDGQGIDVWVGSGKQHNIEGIICNVDLHKRDAELKIVLGCSPQEIRTVLAFHNSDMMGAIFIPRPKEKPR